MCFLSLREEHKLQVLENDITKIFGHKKEEVRDQVVK